MFLDTVSSRQAPSNGSSFSNAASMMGREASSQMQSKFITTMVVSVSYDAILDVHLKNVGDNSINLNRSDKSGEK